MRWPSLLYWPPWQGQAKPSEVACTGQPRCMQRLEKTMNLASGAVQSSTLDLPVLCTQASAEMELRLLGSSTKVFATGAKPCSDSNSETSPSLTGTKLVSSVIGAST